MDLIPKELPLCVLICHSFLKYWCKGFLLFHPNQRVPKSEEHSKQFPLKVFIGEALATTAWGKGNWSGLIVHKRKSLGRNKLGMINEYIRAFKNLSIYKKIEETTSMPRAEHLLRKARENWMLSSLSDLQNSLKQERKAK